MSDTSQRIAALSPDKRALLAQRLAREGAAFKTFPLSFAQERLWTIHQLDPESPAYNLVLAKRLRGALCVPALEQTLAEVVRRHEVLRTRFVTVHGRPVQVVEPAFALPLPVVDLRALPAEEREPEARRRASAAARLPFDLSRGPLVRTTLFRLDDEDHVLAVGMHHIVSDAWSMEVLVGEVAALYRAFSEGRPSPLPALALQYADYAVWQRGRRTGPGREDSLAYWRSRLAGAPPLLALPTDRPRPLVQSFRGRTRSFDLPAAVVSGLGELGRREGATLYMSLLAVFEVLLHRLSGQEDLLVGSPVANREAREVQGLIGFFVNTLVLRGDFSADPTFREHLRRVRSDALEAQSHQDVPFEQLVEEVSPERSLSHTPLCQVALGFHDGARTVLELPDLEVTDFEIEHRTAKFDLVQNFIAGPGGVRGVLHYSTDLFDDPTIERLVGHLVELLGDVTADPDRPVSRLRLVSPAERKALVAEAGGPRAGATPLPGLHEAFVRQVRQTPEAVAVVCGGAALTYRELDVRAHQLAWQLRRRGVGLETRVGICLEPSLDLVVALLAVLKAGGAYVPLDPGHPAERLAFMLEDSGARLAVTQERLRARLPVGLPMVCLDGEAGGATTPGEPPPAPVAPDGAAYVIYTSGSTGRPKGVVVTHANVGRLFETTRDAFRFGPSDVWTLFHSFAFDFSVWELWGALLHGGRLVVVPYAVSRSPEAFLQLLEDEGVTVLNQTPSAFAQLMAAEAASRRDASWSHLRVVVFGGEALDPRRLAPWLERHGDSHPRLVNMYGITETTVHVTYRELTAGCIREGWGSVIGAAIPDLHTYVVDRHLEPVPPGVTGELLVGGAGLARGYLDRPDLTAERFIPDPYTSEPGARMYRSGDLARRRGDGELEYMGRADQQVKVRGYRVELGEIEAALLGHPAVREAAVLQSGAGAEARLVAYVVWKGGPPPLAELRAHLGRSLPEHMVPASFCPLEALPLTRNGKLDRAALPAPDANRPELSQAFVAPRTALEEVLAARWGDVLGVDRVGVHDNFFDLGGDSIKAAVFTNRLREDLGEILHVVTVFDRPTVAEFGRYLEAQCAAALPRLLGRQGAGPAGPRHAESGPRVDGTRLAELRRRIPALPARAADGTVPRNRRAVFVLSPPRSGSTLLRVMLAGHPRLFAPPELELLSFETLAERGQAFRGRDRFWLEGAVRAVMELRGGDAAEAEAVMQQYEDRGLTTRAFYGELQGWLGDRLLVDKTPSYALHESVLERAEEDFEGALYIHLVRDPRGTIRSFEEARLHEIFPRFEHPFAPRELAELLWVVSHQNILRFLERVPASRRHLVRFEHLVSDPRAVVEGLCHFLGLDVQPGMLRPYERSSGRMTDGPRKASSMLGDIKFHQHTSIDADAAVRWKEDGEAWVLGEETWALARALGLETPPPPVMRAERTGPHPLSFAQERLWFLQQLDPETALYNIPASVRLTGRLDRIALERALTEIVRRHEVLRTRVTSVEGRPVQEVRPTSPVALPSCDLGGLAPTEREEEVQRRVDEEARRPFDLGSEGPLRAGLLRLAEDEHVLLLTLHHIAADGWSMGILLRELAALHAAFGRDQASPLPELEVQYADYAAWQRGWPGREVLEGQLAYWRRQLAGAPPLVRLRTDRPRPEEQTYRGAARTQRLPGQLIGTLRGLARGAEATLYMALLAAFDVLLMRASGQTDVSVGTDVAGRPRSELERLIGFFVNALVVRVDLAGDPTFRELLGRVRRTTLEAYRHQDVPFERVVAAVNPERTLAHAPLFQLMFVFQNVPRGRTEAADLALTPVYPREWAAKHDLSLFLSETPEGLDLLWVYSRDLFDEPTIERFGQQYHRLLEAIAGDPDARLSTLLTRSEPARAPASSGEGGPRRTRFREVRPRAVQVAAGDVVRTRELEDRTLPLVVEPALEEVDLARWVGANRGFVDERLRRHGALLFRGFAIDDVAAFEAFARGCCDELFGEYGDLPREGLGGRVYGSTPYPPDKAILYHNESSHLHRWPMRILFGCLQPPARDGETPIVDSRVVLQRLDPALRRRFEDKGLCYVRNFISGLDASWPHFFRTSSRAEVEAQCREAAIEVEWTRDGGLRTRYRCPAVAVHPVTGEPVFFNQVQLHHASRLDEAVGRSLRSLFEEDELPRNVYWGDGRPIESSVVDELVAVCDGAAARLPWQRGDVLLLDNMLAAHARRPYSGPRKVVVAMGDMLGRAHLAPLPSEAVPVGRTSDPARG